jgi:hypothetical protein
VAKIQRIFDGVVSWIIITSIPIQKALCKKQSAFCIFELIRLKSKRKRESETDFFSKARKLKIIRYFIVKRQRFLEILILFLFKVILKVL